MTMTAIPFFCPCLKASLHSFSLTYFVATRTQASKSSSSSADSATSPAKSRERSPVDSW